MESRRKVATSLDSGEVGGANLNEMDIKQKLSYREKDSMLYMPNELFGDLVTCVDFKGDASSHISFGYCYIYLCTWLYRYCNYFQTEKLVQGVLKEILGYVRSNKTVDYIIKKDGLLEELGYLKTTLDYPMFWDYRFDTNAGLLEFIRISDFKSSGETSLWSKFNDRNFKVKFPIKAFYRTSKALEELSLDGTFYDRSNTHMIPVEAFIYSMTNRELGVIALYLYAFLKWKNDRYASGYTISHWQLSDQTGIKASTLDAYLYRLRNHNMIDCEVQPYVFNLPREFWKPNTYRVRDYKLFGLGDEPVEKRKVMSLYSYEREFGEVIDRGSAEANAQDVVLVEIDEDSLPF